MNSIIILLIISGISGKIQGTVIDKDTNKPLAFADVLVLTTELGAATDENGNFFILNVPAGIYTVEVLFLGYQSKKIENVVVEIDQSVRLKIALQPTIIEVEGVTVTGITPTVKKDMVGTTYVVRKEEISYLPFDYTPELVSFQAAVAHFDTAIHVRGGRATEVQYMIDNVSIIDPQTGDPAIVLSRGIVDEVIFLPGSFDAEYGRAMSGLVNMITVHPANRLQVKAYGKTERIMPFYYDFGYENYQSSIHLPVSKRFKGFVSFDVMHTDDWDPKLFILPHKQRDDYSLYGKWIYSPASRFNLNVSGAKSRTRFDRYNLWYKFNLDHYRSDMREGDLEVINASFLPDSRKLFNITLSRLFTQRIYGVRVPGDYGLLENYQYREYNTQKYPRGGYRNPFGISYYQFLDSGDFPEYQDKSSAVYRANINSNLQLHKYHEIRSGVEYTYQDLKNFTYYISGDTLNPITDEYRYKPNEYSVFIQDNIDYEGLYAKIGCRYDHFASGVDTIEPKNMISPRLGISFLVTEKFLFRVNIGRYAQPPLYDYMYRNYNLVSSPSYVEISPVGNPNLRPEKTISLEIGMQGEVQPNMTATINTFYKDITDLIGTRYVPALPNSYVVYMNVEYANVKGLETILDFKNSLFSGKISYTLSWARGTSSYAEEVYRRYYAENPDTNISIPATEYFLDFDQRNRIFIQGTTQLPWKTTLILFGYLGNGFPYTPPGPEGKYEERNYERLPFQRQIDCVLSKSFKISGLNLSVNLDLINLLDERYEIADHYQVIPAEEIMPWDFTGYISLGNSYYSPGADLNHDGVITPYEQYLSFKGLIQESNDWINSYTAPRRARIGISMNF